MTLKNTSLTTEATNFYGDMISTVLKGLIKGAGKEIGSDVMGHILAILGWGNNGQQSELDEMKANQAKILQGIQTIENQISSLISQLNLVEHTLLNDINYPSDAVNNIQACHDIFRERVGSTDTPDSVDGNAMNSDITTYNNYNLRAQVLAITNAIITSSKTPLTTNYIDIILNQVASKHGTLATGYISFELYMSKLLKWQLTGANIIFETLNYQKSNLADSFIQDYRTDQYNALVGDPIDPNFSRESFTASVWSLALSSIKICPKSGTPLFSNEVHDILARGEFFRLTTLGKDRFGIRFLLFTTMDLDVFKYEPPGFLWFYSPETKVSGYMTCHKASVTIQGAIYDRWTGSGTVTPDNEYKAYIGLPNLEDHEILPGTYDISIDQKEYIGKVVVGKYDTDYTPNPDGKITYGCGAALLRTPVNHFTEKYSHWTTHDVDQKDGISTSGSANHLPYVLKGDCPNSGMGYSAWTELRGYFFYNANANLPVKKLVIDYSIEVSGYVEAYADASGNDQATAKYHVAAWDATEGVNKRVTDTNSNHHYASYSSCNDGKKKFTQSSTNTISFTPKSAHHYRFYVYMSIDGGSLHAKSNIGVDTVRYVHIRLVSA